MKLGNKLFLNYIVLCVISVASLFKCYTVYLEDTVLGLLAFTITIKLLYLLILICIVSLLMDVVIGLRGDE